MYVELHSRSAFSFLEGSSLPDHLIARCAELQMPAMALLDRDGVYGAARFHMAAVKAGIKAHIGAEITYQFSPPRLSDTEKHIIGQSTDHLITLCPDHQVSSVPEPALSETEGWLRGKSRLPLLISSRLGYQNLCRLITKMKLRASGKDEGAVFEDELQEYSEGLICLTGGDDGPLAFAFKQGGIEAARRSVERLLYIFGRENVYIELQRHFHREQELRNRAATEIARSLKLPLLATNGVRYVAENARELCDVFTAVRNHCTLSTAGRLLTQNSECHLKSPEQMAKLFADLPEAIANTVELSSRLEFTLEDLGYEFPKYPVPEGESMMSFLRERTREGFETRYGRSSTELQNKARVQIERELALIEKLNLPGYFLIVWDIVNFCCEQNILVQGRGSAANSAVCYSLGITAVDPVGMELLFERFLSEQRGEMPDIDLDLPSGDEREKVIQHLYEKYGERGAAMTANVITYRSRMASREIGKVLGFDLETLDKLSAAVAHWEYRDDNDTFDHRFRDAGLDLRHPRIRKYFELCEAIQDLPRHLGQHSGGMVICQGQLDSVVPLEPASMPGRVVVQWDKDDCTDLGIVKVDLLGLGMMAVLKDSINLIRDHYNEKVDLAHLPADDPEVYSTLQKADTIGMFQIESRAQMSCLPRLKPKKFYDIVVQVAIIRPGPIVGQMVNPYLERRQGRQDVSYAHPSLEPVLKRTLGVPLFQEQLLKMAMAVAGFSGGEAEELRRAMGFKRSEKRMKEIESKLRAGMTRNGISPDAQEEIVLSITSFALYGFPESHAASFALLAYASAYLKCHYLAAFTAALLNNQPMGFYSPATIVKDAQRHGLKVLPIDVTKSEWECTLEHSAFSTQQQDVVRPASLVVGENQQLLGHRSPATDEHLAPKERSNLAQRFSAGKRSVNDVSPGGTAPVTTHTPFIKTDISFCARRTTQDARLASLALRLGLRYVRGLHEEAGRAIAETRKNVPFTSIHDLVHRVSELQKHELNTLAEIGALNSIKNSPRRNRGTEETVNNEFSVSQCLRGEKVFHRRDALWSAAAAANPSGPLFEQTHAPDNKSPLQIMTDEERLVADFRGTGMTIGPHPMSYHRERMDRLGVCRAIELPSLPTGRQVRTAGGVIARQRPGTAKGFVFLSLEDETGVSNAIVTPDLFQQNRLLLSTEQFLLIDGILQNQDGVISVKALNVSPLNITRAQTVSHDFH
ncbi:MAG TPA: error-prone DNA polymerase [Terriglobales bacterium]|nr:error-prone DNA polymerase [Terriglobales bacterium]